MDLLVKETNMQNFSKEIIEKAGRIKLLLTDCDGVLTDGGVYYSKSGEEMKRFSLRDGMGVERLMHMVNVETGIVTGENSEIVRRRAEKLGIKEYHPGSTDKYATLKDILKKRIIYAEEIAYIGDDANDHDIMKHVGLSACPADAFSPTSEIAHLKMSNRGGYGAFREFAEIIIYLKIHGNVHTKESPGWGSHYW